MTNAFMKEIMSFKGEITELMSVSQAKEQKIMETLIEKVESLGKFVKEKDQRVDQLQTELKLHRIKTEFLKAGLPAWKNLWVTYRRMRLNEKPILWKETCYFTT